MRYLLFFLHILILCACYLVYYNGSVDATQFPFLQYVAIVLPVLLFINLFFIVLWLIIKPKIVILFIIGTIGLYPQYKSYYNVSDASTEQGKIKLATYNVRYFYGDMPSFIDWLDTTDPDILITQEHNKTIFDKSSANSYPYYKEYNYVAVSSKYPIIESDNINLPDLTGRMCFADIKIKKDTVRILNVYLQSLKISENLEKTKDATNLTDRSKKLSYRMTKSYQIHKDQINAIRPFIEDSPYPVILGIDMNAVPLSFEYNFFAERLNDAFETHGKGFGFTFFDFIVPLRLDYIFYSDKIDLKNFKIDRSFKFSDHYPIVTEFSIE